MLKIVVIFFIFLIVVGTFFRPWIGLLSYFTVSVLAPQIIWYWGFEGIRVSYIIALANIGSLIYNVLLGKISLSCWKSKQNLMVLFFWVMISLSYYFGALPPNKLSDNSINSDFLFSTYNKLFLMFFLLQPMISDIKIINRLMWVLVVIFGYYVFWGNSQYFSGEMYLRGVRLSGPSTPMVPSIYTDENSLATLFVIAIPFFYYLGLGNSNKIMKGMLFLLIPFAWHGVFLTGSRGGLVGLSAISLQMIVRTKKKSLAIVCSLGLIAAFVYEAGDFMRERSGSIFKYEEEYSAMGRIEAWKFASDLVVDHPFFGVGLGNITVAWEKYKNTKPRVAHSTVIQIAAESGILAGLAFLGICSIVVFDIRNIRKMIKYFQSSSDLKNRSISDILPTVDAVEGSILGLFVCGLFLNLGTYDVFYLFIMMISLLKWNIRHIDQSNGECIPL